MSRQRQKCQQKTFRCNAVLDENRKALVEVIGELRCSSQAEEPVESVDFGSLSSGVVNLFSFVDMKIYLYLLFCVKLFVSCSVLVLGDLSSIFQ